MHSSAYPTLLLAAVVSACSPGFADPPPETTVAVLEPTTGLTRPAGTALDQPLRVLVRVNGTPTAGIQVTWQASLGQLTATTTRTDAEGIATTRWQLGTTVGTQQVWATIRESNRPAYFVVEATPGAPAQVVEVSGDGQEVNILARMTVQDLVVRVLDPFDNPIPDAAVVWSVLEGPVEIASPPRAEGTYYRLTVAGTGQAGTARIQASAGGVSMAAPFTIVFGEGPWVVAISNLNTYHLIGFLSGQNGTVPAIDTLPPGQRVQFRNEDYWDVAQSHDVVAVGEPAMPTCALVTYAYDSSCEVTLTPPGTYRYRLSGNPLVTGTLVVRSP